MSAEPKNGFVKCTVGVVGNKDDEVLPGWKAGGLFWQKDLQVGALVPINGKLFQVKDVRCEYISDINNGVYPNVFHAILELVK